MNEKELPGQLTIEECILIAKEEDLVRLAAEPQITLRQAVAERRVREEQANDGSKRE